MFLSFFFCYIPVAISQSMLNFFSRHWVSPLNRVFFELFYWLKLSALRLHVEICNMSFLPFCSFLSAKYNILFCRFIISINNYNKNSFSHMLLSLDVLPLRTTNKYIYINKTKNCNCETYIIIKTVSVAFSSLACGEQHARRELSERLLLCLWPTIVNVDVIIKNYWRLHVTNIFPAGLFRSLFFFFSI